MNGNVGIGTTSPQAKLDVRGNISTGQDGSGGQLILAAMDSGSEGGEITWNGAGNYDNWAQDVYQNNMRFYTSSTGNNQVQIFNASSGNGGLYVEGNVGIGTSTPNEKLTVDGGTIKATTSASTGTGVSGYATNTGGYFNYGGYFEAAGGSGRGVYGCASNTGIIDNYGGYFEAKGGLGKGVYGHASSTNDWSHYGGYFVAAGIYGYGVYGKGNLYDFYAAGPGTDYGTASSIRWKTNIQPINNPLDKVLRLRGVYFDWDTEHGGGHGVGMIAEEVGQVLPEIVEYEENGIDATGMDYSKLTPLLVEAVKALKSEVDELREHNKKLEERLLAVEKLMGKQALELEGGQR
jgi:hypothetical protein